MKRNLFVLLPATFIALPFLLNPASAAQPVHPVDVRSFDVAGVKSGMSVEEARSAMQKNFGVSADKIVASDSMDYQTPTVITGSKQVMYLVYENDGTRMQVSFQPRVPYNKINPMAADLISYEIPWTNENQEAMKKAALAKYGPVSISSMYPLWCEKPIPGTGMGCESGSAQLEQSSTKITLTDPAWQNAVIKYMDEKKTTKPQF
ncbi:hypothetical protein [Erwinia sp. B116]|uniref:hypothetical protein n=1 Tax=Erwinia sp. B116 TaxID=1561024 RepID=UPI000C762B58|nr:hypothetical protein [Erwinia sp. B116]